MIIFTKSEGEKQFKDLTFHKNGEPKTAIRPIKAKDGTYYLSDDMESKVTAKFTKGTVAESNKIKL